MRRGDPARDLPACTACHGAAMTGVRPAVPGLLGLPRDYLIGQLGAWQTGLRKAHAPDCMAQVAQRLAAPDIAAVAAVLASAALAWRVLGLMEDRRDSRQALDEAAARLVAVIRRERPQVIITYGEHTVIFTR